LVDEAGLAPLEHAVTVDVDALEHLVVDQGLEELRRCRAPLLDDGEREMLASPQGLAGGGIPRGAQLVIEREGGELILALLAGALALERAGFLASGRHQDRRHPEGRRREHDVRHVADQLASIRRNHPEAGALHLLRRRAAAALNHRPAPDAFAPLVYRPIVGAHRLPLLALDLDLLEGEGDLLQLHGVEGLAFFTPELQPLPARRW